MFTINGDALNLLIAAWVFPFVRIMAMLSTAPIYDQRSLPIQVRIGLSAIIALLLAQTLPQPVPINDPMTVAIIAQQILIGVALGFSMKIVFAAFQFAGDIIGLQMGLAFAQFVDPEKGSVSPLIGSFLTILASLIFLSMEGHLMLIDAVTKSFDVVPVGSPSSGVTFENIVLAGGMLFMLGLQIALPVVGALLVANLVLGILTKASPQMNLMSVGFSLTIAMGILVLSFSVPYMVSTFAEALTRVASVAILRAQ